MISPWWSSCSAHGLPNRGLEILAGRALTAWHPLYDLYRLSAFVFNYVSYVDEALIAAVGRLVRENFGGVSAYTWCVHSSSPFLWAGSRGVSSTRGAISFVYNLLPLSLTFYNL
jgi:hypothetical protein